MSIMEIPYVYIEKPEEVAPTPHVEIDPVQDFIAGTAAGVALTLSGHPFDTVKVRMQTAPIFSSGWDCFLKTVKTEGPMALYKGMSGPMATVPLVNAIVFAAYAQAKDWFHKEQTETKPLSLTEVTLCGAYAGFVNCFIASPVELIKTRLQIQYESAGVIAHHNIDKTLTFAGPFDALKKIYAKWGLKGLYRGMAATVYREIPGYGGQFFMYELLKRKFAEYNRTSTQDLGAFPLIVSGGLSGIFGWIMSYPMDYVKSQIQAESYAIKTPYPKNPYLFDGGFISCWKQTVQESGHRALWRGFGPCVARAFPANAAGFLAYEMCLSAFRKNSAATNAQSSINPPPPSKLPTPHASNSQS